MQDYTDTIAADWGRLYPELNAGLFEVGMRLLRVGRIVEAALDEVATRHGLVVSGDYEVLAALRRAHPQPLQPATLADRTMISTSGMTGRLDRLEAAGLVERRPNPRDRRAIDIHVSEKGCDLADRVFHEFLGAVTARFGALRPADIKRLSGVLRSLLVQLGDLLPEDDSPKMG